MGTELYGLPLNKKKFPINNCSFFIKYNQYYQQMISKNIRFAHSIKGVRVRLFSFSFTYYKLTLFSKKILKDQQLKLIAMH
jgi:hypothetical protein